MHLNMPARRQSMLAGMHGKPAPVSELTLRIAERANRLAAARPPAPGRELELWLEAEAEVKRELARRAGEQAFHRDER